MRKVQNIDEKKMSTLCSGFLLLKTEAECRAFLRDLCTLGELQDLSERLDVAQKISAGLPYREIAGQTGVSTATITRVGQWLNHGEGGYRLILDRLAKKSPAAQKHPHHS